MGRVIDFNERMPVLEVAGGCIVSKTGDITMGLALEKPELFTLGAAEYGLLHETFVKAMKLLAPGTVVHFQDIYREDHWRPAEGAAHTPDRAGGGGWLGAASDRFFTGRRFVRHAAYCYLTRRPAGRRVVNSAGSGLLRRWLVPPDTLDERSVTELREKLRQFAAVLAGSGMVKVRQLSTEELTSTAKRAGLIEQYCYLLEGQQPVMRDIDFRDGLRVGSREAVMFTLGEAAHLPSSCSPAVPFAPFSGEQSKVYTGFLSGLGLLLPGNHLVNQYIVVGDGPATWARLERKRLRMHSLSKYSRSNAVAAEAANAYLSEAMREQRVPARVHVNVLAWADRPSDLAEVRARLVSAISALDAVPHEETLGLPQLWWAGIPGNAGDLPENECWDTFLEQAACFLQYESNYRDSPGTFGVRLGDRLTGKPILVDLDVTPRQLGWTQNGNLFVLAGSGGGKSFFMNHLCRSYFDLGMHIVLIDVGHSYRGLCELLHGYYFTYEESRPMRFNPFHIAPGEVFDTEKKESLKSLLMALWKRSDETQYRSEYVALTNALQAYYDWLGRGSFSEAGANMGPGAGSAAGVVGGSESEAGVKSGAEAGLRFGGFAPGAGDGGSERPQDGGFMQGPSAGDGEHPRDGGFTPGAGPGGNGRPVACFDTFYEFMAGEYRQVVASQGVKAKEFDLENFLYVVRPYYRGGEFDFLLNGTGQLDLLKERFIVFELDNIKDHPILFPVVTLVIMEVFLSKMRRLRGVRKMIVIEEAWKAIANAGMAANIQYWVKTLRKFMGKLALVSQEIEDMIESPIVKQAIINNSDTRILLDQSKFQNRFDAIQALLGLTEKQKAEILSINRGHEPGRAYKDLWIGLGPAVSHVYRLEVSPEEYWVYTTEQSEKLRMEEYVRKYGGVKEGVERLVREG
jgi:hypothetical protein